MVYSRNVDQLCFAYVKTDIDPKNDNFENTVDNGTSDLSSNT